MDHWLCRGDLCKTGTTYPLELFSGKGGTGLSGLHNWRMGGNEGSAYHRISPLVYDAAKPEKQELQSVFFEKKCAAYQHFPVETYLAEQLFTILKYLELIPSMEVYDTTFRLLKQETVDGRHIYETLSFFCEKEEVIPQEKRIEMLESYDTYTYMKKRWEKYVRKQGMENVSWETVLHRIVLFLRPVWNAMCRDEVFFGDWMPDLERYL